MRGWILQIHHMGASNNRGTPKSSHVNRVFHYKPSILGYHHFWKHLYDHGSGDMFVFFWKVTKLGGTPICLSNFLGRVNWFLPISRTKQTKKVAKSPWYRLSFLYMESPVWSLSDALGPGWQDGSLNSPFNLITIPPIPEFDADTWALEDGFEGVVSWFFFFNAVLPNWTPNVWNVYQLENWDPNMFFFPLRKV